MHAKGTKRDIEPIAEGEGDFLIPAWQDSDGDGEVEAVSGEGPDLPQGDLSADEPEGQAAIGAADADAATQEPDDSRQWFVIHCYSGYESKVKHNLEQRIDSMEMQDKIFQVVVPTEDEIEVRDGKRRVIERRVFPGYILVQMKQVRLPDGTMKLPDDSWHVVRNTPGVTGFVGMGNEPMRKSWTFNRVMRSEFPPMSPKASPVPNL